MTSRLLLLANAIVIATAGACAFEDAAFGRACDDDDDCAGDEGFVCVQEVCVPRGFDFGEGTEGEGEGTEGEGEAAAGDACEDSLSLVPDVPRTATTATALNDLSAICGGNEGPDRAFHIDLAARTNLRVTVDADGFDAAVYASAEVSCASIISGTCTDNDHSSGGVEAMVLAGVGPGRIFVVVDGADQQLLPTSGSFTITASVDNSCDEGFTSVNNRCVGVVKQVNQVRDRTNAAALLLDDGKVLVAGGRSGADLATTTSAELFDPSTDTFTATGNMTIDRARHCMERLDDGRVLVVGGVRGSDGDYLPTVSAEIYDPTTGLWTPAPDLPRARDLFTCTLLTDGRVYVAGGRDEGVTLDDAWALAADQSAWVAQENLIEARFGHLAFRPVDDEDVLLVGGRTGDAALALDTVEKYDASVGDTDPVASLGDPRAAACAAFVDDGHLAVFGGYEGSFTTEILGHRSAEVYDLEDDDWTGVFGDSADARLFSTANLMPGVGVIVVAGGADDPTASVDFYDEAADGFVALPALQHARLAHVAVTLDDGRVLVIGGDGGSAGTTTPLAVAEIIGVQR